MANEREKNPGVFHLMEKHSRGLWGHERDNGSLKINSLFCYSFRLIENLQRQNT